MKDKVFLDSNVIIYSYSSNDIHRQHIARKIISENESHISTQVLQEVTNIIVRKFKFNFADARLVISECCRNNILHINSDVTVIAACDIAEKYLFSFFDSLIIASAIEAQCDILYSEDLQDGQVINGALKIKNPFSSAQ